MRILAVIPARGGSKGIPHKNIVEIDGRPLITYMISEALKSKHITDLYVSTDDKDIADVAIEWGAKVIERPDELSNDESSSESALIHALEAIEAEYDALVLLQCTSPLTLTKDIDGTIEAFLCDDTANSALSICEFDHFLWSKNPYMGNLTGLNHIHLIPRKRRQDKEARPSYLETGAVYVMSVERFKLIQNRFIDKVAHYEMPRERCFEIDNPIDIRIAQELLNDMKKSGIDK